MQAASSPLARFGLAFLLAYFCLYNTLWWLPPWQALVVQLSTRLLHVTTAVMPAGGSDTAFNYVELPFLALVRHPVSREPPKVAPRALRVAEPRLPLDHGRAGLPMTLDTDTLNPFNLVRRQERS
jgi:hypothetical protein